MNIKVKVRGKQADCQSFYENYNSQLMCNPDAQLLANSTKRDVDMVDADQDQAALNIQTKPAQRKSAKVNSPNKIKKEAKKKRTGNQKEQDEEGAISEGGSVGS